MKKHDIILYDGVCVFCNKWVSFIIKNDKNKKFKFASIQSNFAKNILEEIGASRKCIDTIFVLKSDVFFTKFRASTYALYRVNKLFIFAYSLNFIFPKIFLDFFYDLFGSNRYKIFGKYETCPLPDPKIKDRFLDG